MHDFSHDYPPYLYLVQVSEHCPKALSTYLSIWKNRDKNNELKIYKEDIRIEYLTSLAKFRHDLFLLVKEGLVSIQENNLTIHMELVGWDDEEESFA